MNDQVQATLNPVVLEKVYSEASHWVRQANQVVWGVGTLFVPTSVAALWFAVTTSASRPLLAAASLFMFAFWIAVSVLYARTSLIARNALVAIERSWELDPALRVFTLQSKYVTGSITVIRLQSVSFAVLIATWGFIIFLAPPIVPVK